MERGASLTVEFDSRLVEEVVQRFLRDRPAATYWQERERIYAIEDLEDRNHAFVRLHQEQFEAWALGDPFYKAIEEQPLLAVYADRFRVMASTSRRDEGAELFVAPTAVQPDPSSRRSIVVRVNSGDFSRPERLLELLRHELFHIADMLDPAFGYDPALPEVDGGPARLKLVVDRYRVLWDTVIDGRLWRLERGLPETRELRRREFSEAFWMLGDRSEDAFLEWFELSAPSHATMLRFALDPPGKTARTAAAGATICPLCECPGVIDPGLTQSLSPAVVNEILQDFPRWCAADGACAQCIDLYRGRPLSRAAAGQLPR